jgi:hypothetical protein
MANHPSALEVLAGEIAELENQLAGKKRAYAELAKLSGSTSTPGLHISPTTFEGMKIAEAVAKYLRMVSRPASLEEVKEALARGGADLGKETERYARNLKIAVRMNSQPKHALSYNEEQDVVALRSQKVNKQTA